MAAKNLPVDSATPATKYILSTDSRQRVYEHACELNNEIFDKKSKRKRGHANREQDPGYKAGLGSEMNMLCMKPKCWDPIVKRPRTLKDHHVVKHEEVVFFHCGPCGEAYEHSHSLIITYRISMAVAVTAACFISLLSILGLLHPLVFLIQSWKMGLVGVRTL